MSEYIFCDDPVCECEKCADDYERDIEVLTNRINELESGILLSQLPTFDVVPLVRKDFEIYERFSNIKSKLIRIINEK